MRDDLKDRMVGLMKEAWAQGYEAGVHATNVDCGVVWEERIDAIKAEILNNYISGDGTIGKMRVWEYDEIIRLIDKHCGGGNE